MTSGRTIIAEQAQLAATTMRNVTDNLSSAGAEARLARHQIAATIELLQRMDRDLEQLAECAPVLNVGALCDRVAATYRTARGIGDAPVRVAAFFARLLDTYSRLADGQTPANADPSEVEAIRLAVRAQGVGTAALTHFAMTYPEHARKIDRASLDRLVIAFSVESVAGGRWPVVADVWKRRLGRHLAPVSIKNEIAKLPKSFP